MAQVCELFFVDEYLYKVVFISLFKAAGQQVGPVFPQAGAFYMPPLAQVKICLNACKL